MMITHDEMLDMRKKDLKKYLAELKKMKVKELIEKLKTFDQEKNIWVYYDLCSEQEPDFVQCEEDETSSYPNREPLIKAGDYVHYAW